GRGSRVREPLPAPADPDRRRVAPVLRRRGALLDVRDARRALPPRRRVLLRGPVPRAIAPRGPGPRRRGRRDLDRGCANLSGRRRRMSGGGKAGPGGTVRLEDPKDFQREVARAIKTRLAPALVVIAGPDVGTSMRLDRSIAIGRDPN